MPRRIRWLWFLSALTLGVIYLLSIWTKSGYIVAEVRASEVAFRLQSPVANLLQLNKQLAKAESFSVEGFSFITMGEAKVAPLGEAEQYPPSFWRVEPEEMDVSTHSASFTNLMPNLETLPAGVEVRMAVSQGRTGKVALRVQLLNLEEGISLSPQQTSFSITPKRARLYALQEDVAFYEPVEVVCDDRLPWQVIPQEGRLTFTYTFKESPSLQEEDVLLVKALQFNTLLPDRERSAVLGGTLRVEENKKNLDLVRNAYLDVGKRASWEITNLRMKEEAFLLNFEGRTSHLEVSYSHRNYLPSVLEWLVNNNYLLLLINTYLVVISLYLSISDRYRNEQDRAAQKEKSS